MKIQTWEERDLKVNNRVRIALMKKKPSVMKWHKIL